MRIIIWPEPSSVQTDILHLFCSVQFCILNSTLSSKLDWICFSNFKSFILNPKIQSSLTNQIFPWSLVLGDVQSFSSAIDWTLWKSDFPNTLILKLDITGISFIKMYKLSLYLKSAHPVCRVDDGEVCVMRGDYEWWSTTQRCPLVVGHLTKFLLEIESEKFRPPTIPTIRFRIASKNISRNHRCDKFHIGRRRTSDWNEQRSHLPSRRWQ